MGIVTTLELETGATERPMGRGQVVLVVEDGQRLSRTIQYICDYLSLPMQSVSREADLAPILDRMQPMAIVCELDGRAQDGCHIMKLVAAHDRGLPFLLVTGGDETLIAAATAVEEIYCLSNVRKLTDAPGLGDVVEFLLNSGRFGGTPHLLAA